MKARLLKKCVSIFIITFLSIFAGKAQTELYSENFTGQNGKGQIGTTNDTTGVNWTIDISEGLFTANTDFFAVMSERFEGQDLDGLVFWNSPEFSVFNYDNLSISIDLGADGDFEASGDEFFVSIIFDGNPITEEILFEAIVDEDAAGDPMFVDGIQLNDVLQNFTKSISDTGINAKIVVGIINNAGSELNSFDNISVSGIYNPEDFIYDNAWIPNDPSAPNVDDVASTFDSNISIINGTATVAGDFVGGEFLVSPNATFSLDTGLTATLKSLIIESDASFVLGNGANLNMEGNITNSGLADFKNGNVSYNVSGGDLVAGGNGIYDFRNLTLTGNSFTFESPNTSIFGALSPFMLSSINFNGNVTFKSNENSTGITTNFTGTTANGNVTVERYIPAKRAFRLLASSVNTTTTIRENWQNNGLEVSGIGTDITGTGGATNGFDETATNNPSMFTVDEAATPEPEYVAVDNTNVNTLNVGTGYLMLVRGDRTIDLSTNTPTPTPTTLTATGALHVGDFNVPTADIDQDGIGNASSLVANPYQAPVDMAEILGNQTDNINDQFIHVYDPTLGDRGAFVTVDVIMNTNSFTFDDGGSGQMASASAASKILQVGQACFVNTDQTIDPLNPTASITFMESNKFLSTAYVPIFRPSNNTPELLSVALFNSQEFGENKPPKDGLVIRFAEEYSNDKDRFDAKKQFNLDENIATSIDDIISSIQSRALPTVGEEIALFTNNLTTSSYTLRVNLGAIENVEAYLVDNYTNSETALANNDTTLVQFNVDEDIEESMASNRFKVIFKERVLSNDNVTASQFTIYPNPANNSLFIQTSNEIFSKGSVRIFNILGQSVLTSELTTSKQSIDVSKINSGVYLVKIDVEGHTVTKRIIIQ